MNEHIPRVGSVGYFTALPPLTQLLLDNVTYKVVSVRTLREMNSNEDIVNTLYLNNGLTENEFYNDLANNIHIIGLESSSGVVYFPSNRLNSAVYGNGIQVQSNTLSIPIGPLPLTFNLESIKTSINDILKSEIGITSSVSVLKTSEVTLLPETEVNDYMNMLSAARTHALPPEARYNELNTKYLELLRINTCLQSFITGNLCVDGNSNVASAASCLGILDASGITLANSCVLTYDSDLNTLIITCPNGTVTAFNLNSNAITITHNTSSTHIPYLDHFQHPELSEITGVGNTTDHGSSTDKAGGAD